MTREQFELTRTFLKKYSLHFAETTAARLGYAMDDRFYGLDGDGHLARFRRMMDELTLEDVNAAIKRHLQYDNLKIAIVTGRCRERCARCSRATRRRRSPTRRRSRTRSSAEDRVIAAWPLDACRQSA